MSANDVINANLPNLEVDLNENKRVMAVFGNIFDIQHAKASSLRDTPHCANVHIACLQRPVVRYCKDYDDHQLISIVV